MPGKALWGLPPAIGLRCTYRLPLARRSAHITILEAPDGAQALRHGAAIAISMEFHGWPIAIDKSATIPNQVVVIVVYGGGLLDSRYLWGQMPETKRIAQNRRLRSLAQAIVTRGFYTSRREIATGCMMCRSNQNQMWVYGAAVHMMYTSHPPTGHPQQLDAGLGLHDQRTGGGTGLCKHGRHKNQCKECGGSGLCKHGRQKSKCKEEPCKTLADDR